MPGITSFQFIDSNGRVIGSQDPDLLVMPASNMKVVSGYAAYRLLGRDHVFMTHFSLKGNALCVHGDPTFLLDGPKLLEIGRAISAGNPKIEEIVLDNSLMDQTPYGPGWTIDDRKYTYQSKIAPFSVNEGSTTGHNPPLDRLSDPHGEKLKPVRNQARFFAESLWKALGLNSEVHYRLGKDSGGKVVHTYSVTLIDLLKHTESVSCNFSIEVLTKLLPYKTQGVKGTWKRGINAITRVLKGLGLDLDELKFMDGSGLSRLNLLTTEFLSRLVYKISQSEDRDFLKLLPSSGTGTLSKRFPDLADYGINAKTGSIKYCSSLTGFSRKTGISFSIVINNYTDGPGSLPEKVDHILRTELKKIGQMRF